MKDCQDIRYEDATLSTFVERNKVIRHWVESLLLCLFVLCRTLEPKKKILILRKKRKSSKFLNSQSFSSNLVALSIERMENRKILNTSLPDSIDTSAWCVPGFFVFCHLSSLKSFAFEEHQLNRSAFEDALEGRWVQLEKIYLPEFDTFARRAESWIILSYNFCSVQFRIKHKTCPK